MRDPDTITSGIIAEIRAERRHRCGRWRAIRCFCEGMALGAAAPVAALLAVYGWHALVIPAFTSGPHDCRAPALMLVWNLPAWALVPPEWFAAFVRWSVQFCVHG